MFLRGQSHLGVCIKSVKVLYWLEIHESKLECMSLSCKFFTTLCNLIDSIDLYLFLKINTTSKCRVFFTAL